MHPALLAAHGNLHAGHAPTSRDQAPAQHTTVPVAIRPWVVSTADDPAFLHGDADDVAALANVEAARVPLHDVLGRWPSLAECRREQPPRIELGDDGQRLVHR